MSVSPKTSDTRPRSVRPLRIRSRNLFRLVISAVSSGMAETHLARRIHLDGRGHINAAEMTKITEATDKPREMTPPPKGRPPQGGR